MDPKDKVLWKKRSGVSESELQDIFNRTEEISGKLAVVRAHAEGMNYAKQDNFLEHLLEDYMQELEIELSSIRTVLTPKLNAFNMLKEDEKK